MTVFGIFIVFVLLIFQFLKNGTQQWTYYQEAIGGGNTSYVIKNLEPDNAYKLKLTAENEIGFGNTYTTPDFVRTLEKGETLIRYYWACY